MKEIQDTNDKIMTAKGRRERSKTLRVRKVQKRLEEEDTRLRNYYENKKLEEEEQEVLDKYWTVVEGPCKTCAINNLVEDEGVDIAEQELKEYKAEMAREKSKSKSPRPQLVHSNSPSKARASLFKAYQ